MIDGSFADYSKSDCMAIVEMRLTTLSRKVTSEREFVAFWSALFVDRRAELYRKNIGKPLTASRLLGLFKWKNGGRIAAHKLRSIKKNYLDCAPIPPPLGNDGELVSFICQPGGAIWRIFWLHCHSPDIYPIFDQHVYRAMMHLKTGKIIEIGKGNDAKAAQYVHEYLPFHAQFSSSNKKKLDEALWVYGKYLKSQYAI